MPYGKQCTSFRYYLQVLESLKFVPGVFPHNHPPRYGGFNFHIFPWVQQESREFFLP